MTCPFALCTWSLDAQVGQEGIGKADQMQVCNCRPIGAILVLAEPQQLLGVFYPLLNGPALFVRPDDVCSGELRGIGDEPQDLFGRAFPREDHVQGAELADHQPAGIHKAIAERPIRLRKVEGVRAAPPKQIAPIATGVEFPALLEEAAVAFQGRGKVKLLLPASLHDRRAQIIGIKEDQHLDTRRGLEFPDELGGQFGGFPEGKLQGGTLGFF